MFFTISAVDNVIIDLDSFHDDSGHARLGTILNILRSAEKKIIFVASSDKNLGAFPLSQNSIVFPRSKTELQVFQNVLRRAITELEGKTTSAIFITSDGRKIKSAHELLLGTVALCNPPVTDDQQIQIYENFPDFVLDDADGLANVLSGKHIGHFGEVMALEKSSIFRVNNEMLFSLEVVPNKEYADSPVTICGRYFGVEDARHSLHPLSIRLRNSKDHPERHADCFGSIFAQATAYMTEGAFDIICCVPSRPEKLNRLSLYAAKIANDASFSKCQDAHSRLNSELIQCPLKYPEIKSKGPDQRRLALANQFQVLADLTGKTIVLLDDICTTKSTINESIRALKKAGAEKVVPIVLGYHPYKLQTLALTDSNELYCEFQNCRKALTPRTKKVDGEPFYGCTGFHQGGQHTNKGMIEAVKEKLNLLQSKLLTLDSELSSDDFEF